MPKRRPMGPVAFPITIRPYSPSNRTERQKLVRAHQLLKFELARTNPGLNVDEHMSSLREAGILLTVDDTLHTALEAARRELDRGSALPARLENELLAFHRAQVKAREPGALVNMVNFFHRSGYALHKGSSNLAPTAFEAAAWMLDMGPDNVQRIYNATLNVLESPTQT